MLRRMLFFFLFLQSQKTYLHCLSRGEMIVFFPLSFPNSRKIALPNLRYCVQYLSPFLNRRYECVLCPPFSPFAAKRILFFSSSLSHNVGETYLFVTQGARWERRLLFSNVNERLLPFPLSRKKLTFFLFLFFFPFPLGDPDSCC